MNIPLTFTVIAHRGADDLADRFDYLRNPAETPRLTSGAKVWDVSIRDHGEDIDAIASTSYVSVLVCSEHHIDGVTTETPGRTMAERIDRAEYTLHIPDDIHE